MTMGILYLMHWILIIKHWLVANACITDGILLMLDRNFSSVDPLVHGLQAVQGTALVSVNLSCGTTRIHTNPT